MSVERRKDYIELSEIKVHLATVIERLDNLIEHFTNHQDEDKKVESRVQKLERFQSWVLGGVAVCAFFLGGFLKSKGIL